MSKIGISTRMVDEEKVVVLLRKEDGGLDTPIMELRGEAAEFVDELLGDSFDLGLELDKIHEFQHEHGGARVSSESWGENVVEWLIAYARRLETQTSREPEYMKLRVEGQERRLLHQNAEISTLRKLIGRDKLALHYEADDLRRRLDEGQEWKMSQKNAELARLRKLIGKDKLDLAGDVFALRELILTASFIAASSSVERGDYYRLEIREDDYKAVRSGKLKCKTERRDKESTRRPRVNGLMRELAGYIVFLEGYWAPKMSAEVSRGRYLLSKEAIDLLGGNNK